MTRRPTRRMPLISVRHRQIKIATFDAVLMSRASSTIKPLARSRLRVVWLIGACVLVSGAIGLSLRSNRRAERALDRLLTAPLTIWRSPPETFDNFSDRESGGGMALLLRSGTNCVPYLCRELRRRETALNRLYVARWRTLPAFLTPILSEPVPSRP